MDEEGLGTEIKNLKARRIPQGSGPRREVITVRRKPPASGGSEASNRDTYQGTGRRVGRDENRHEYEAEVEIRGK